MFDFYMRVARVLGTSLLQICPKPKPQAYEFQRFSRIALGPSQERSDFDEFRQYIMAADENNVRAPCLHLFTDQTFLSPG